MNQTQTNELKIAQLDQALKAMSMDFNGAGGGFARAACVLDEILDTNGDFVAVNYQFEDYEQIDFVYLRWEGLLWDIGGASTPAEAQESWNVDGESPATFKDFTSRDLAVIISNFDESGLFKGMFDPEEFSVQLRARLQEHGWPLESRPPPPSPRLR